MPENDLLQRVRRLHSLRQKALSSAEHLKLKSEVFAIANAGIILAAKADKNAVEAEETALRAVALAEYERTKEKALAPGVEIKVGVDYKVDEEKALEWALNAKMCIIPAALDLDAVKKVAAVTELPFATPFDVPKAFLSKDLSKVLPPVEPDPVRDATLEHIEDALDLPVGTL